MNRLTFRFNRLFIAVAVLAAMGLFQIAGITQAEAAVAVDNHANYVDDTFHSSTTTDSLSYYVGSGSNMLLVVTVGIDEVTPGVGKVTGISYGAQNFSATSSSASNTNNMRDELWYLDAPSAGTSTLAITFSGPVVSVKIGVLSVSNAAQTGPDNSSSGGASTGGPITRSSGSDNGGFLLGAVVDTLNPALTATTGMNVILNDNSGTTTSALGYYLTTGGTYNLYWTDPDSTDNWLEIYSGWNFVSGSVVVPTVTSPTSSSVLATSATIGATVTSNGGGTLTAVGTCIGLSASTSTMTCHADSGDTVTGPFSMLSSSLTATTTYYFVGYAVNSAGIGYSGYGSFTTSGASAIENGSLTSGTFDTQQTNGVSYNSIMWQGSAGTGGTSTVEFQFAASNCSNGSPNYPGCGATGNFSGPIDPVNYWAWNDMEGWINFSTAAVGSTNLTGYATVSSTGDVIALDCATAPGGSVCGSSNFTVSDTNNALAGWAWDNQYGWISFCGNSSGGSSTYSSSTSSWVCPGTVTYQVKISSSTGQFSGWAWNDILGWISFNCSNTSSCSSSNSPYAQSNYYVQVDGSASSWSFTGPDDTGNTYYVASPGIPVPLVGSYYDNDRYYRYQIYLSGTGSSTGPQVKDVIVNWSP